MGQVSGIQCFRRRTQGPHFSSATEPDTPRLLHFYSFQCEEAVMPGKKRKKKTFTAAKAVRELARERVGSPKPSQLVRAKKSKPEKYKPTLGKLLAEE